MRSWPAFPFRGAFALLIDPEPDSHALGFLQPMSGRERENPIAREQEQRRGTDAEKVKQESSSTRGLWGAGLLSACHSEVDSRQSQRRGPPGGGHK